VKEPANEAKPASVGKSGVSPAFPKQAGDRPAPWAWVARCVWTERMLKRLAESREQTVWYSLWDKVWDEGNLWQASLEVIMNRGSAGVDGQTTTQYHKEWREEIARLQKELQGGGYRPQPARRVWIPKAGSTELRPLGIPAVRDRVVQAAVRHVLEPIFERDFAEQSYGFRPGRGCLNALGRVEELLGSGHPWVVDADLKSYFDTIPRDRLLERVSARVADGRVLALLRAFLEAGVMETGKDWQPTERGTPQGGVISPLLANLYLNPLDHRMGRAGYEMVRYADDLVILCRSEAEAKAALASLTVWVEEAGLTLHPVKTRILDAAEKGGFDFLGYHFEQYRPGGGKKWPRRKSEQKLRDRLRPMLRRGRSGEIAAIVAEINPILRGWGGYFKYGLATGLVWMDAWVRERLRHILRRRHKRKGMVQGREHREYPNAWFAAQGLLSLKTLQEQWLQSLTGNH
jgi:RNA-directed DNA polymerase